MCNAQSFALNKQTPITASGPTPDFQPGQGTTTDPETGLTAPNPGQITQAPGGATSQSVVGEQSSPTKFGMLMKVLAPALQGGLIGWAGGKGTPGGGFNAANNHFQQQRQLQMQYALMNRQMYNDQFRNALELARTQHEMNMPGITRVPNTVPGKDAQGNPIQEWYNPYSRQWEVVPGSVGKATPKAPKTTISTDSKGNQVLVNEDNATAKPIVMEQSPEEGSESVETNLPGGLPKAPTPQEMARTRGLLDWKPGADQKFSMPLKPTGGPSTATGQTSVSTVSPTKPGQPGGAGVAPASGGPLPLGPKFTKPGSENNQLETKAEAALRAQHPDWDDMQIYAALKRAGQKPEDNGTTIKPQQERVLRSQFATREEADLRQLQAQQEKDLDDLNKNEFADPKDVAAKQQAIQAKYDGQRQAVHSRMVQEAAGLGIDLDTPMAGSKKGNSVPTKPGNSNGNKALDDATARKIFAEAGNDPVKARKLAAQRGYKIPAAPAAQ